MLRLKEKVQLILMFVVMTGNTVYMSSPLYFVYLDSWIKQANPQFSYSELYMMFNLMDIGIPVFNSISHWLIPLIGIKSIIVLGGPLFIFTCVGLYYSAHFGIMVAASLLMGMTHQVFVVVIMEIITRKHPRHYMGYVGKVFSAYSLTRAIWTVLIHWIINPANEPTTRATIIDGHTEYYYSKRVTDRFPTLLWTIMGYGIFTTSFLGLFLSDPTFKTSVVYQKIFGDSSSEKNRRPLLLESNTSTQIDHLDKWFPSFRSFYVAGNYQIENQNTVQRVRFYSVDAKDLEKIIPLKQLSSVSFRYVNICL